MGRPWAKLRGRSCLLTPVQHPRAWDFTLEMLRAGKQRGWVQTGACETPVLDIAPFADAATRHPRWPDGPQGSERSALSHPLCPFSHLRCWLCVPGSASASHPSALLLWDCLSTPAAPRSCPCRRRLWWGPASAVVRCPSCTRPDSTARCRPPHSSALHRTCLLPSVHEVKGQNRIFTSLAVNVNPWHAGTTAATES